MACRCAGSPIPAVRPKQLGDHQSPSSCRSKNLEILTVLSPPSLCEHPSALLRRNDSGQPASSSLPHMLPWESPPSSSSLGSGLRRASIQSLDDRPWGWARSASAFPNIPDINLNSPRVSPHHVGCQHQCHHLLKSIQAILRAGLQGRARSRRVLGSRTRLG